MKTTKNVENNMVALLVQIAHFARGAGVRGLLYPREFDCLEAVGPREMYTWNFRIERGETRAEMRVEFVSHSDNFDGPVEDADGNHYRRMELQVESSCYSQSRMNAGDALLHSRVIADLAELHAEIEAKFGNKICHRLLNTKEERDAAALEHRKGKLRSELLLVCKDAMAGKRVGHVVPRELSPVIPGELLELLGSIAIEERIELADGRKRFAIDLSETGTKVGLTSVWIRRLEDAA